MQQRIRRKKNNLSSARTRAKNGGGVGRRKRSNNSREAATVLSRLRKTLDETAAKLKALLPAKAKANARKDANEMS